MLRVGVRATLGIIGYYREAVDQRLDARDVNPGPQYIREPLTTSQHILHLLLTVFTVGLWAPAWIVRAVQGNKRQPIQGAGPSPDPTAPSDPATS